MTPSEWIIWGGLVLGLLYGIAAQASGFCLNSAVLNQVCRQQSDKLKSFMLAVVVAMLGTQAIAVAGLVDLSGSIYATPQFSWLLVPLGGLLFGYGMILARGCGARSLVLLGQGNLRSLVVLLCLGISAFATLTGVLGPLRASINETTLVQLEQASFSSSIARWGFVALFSVSLLAFVFKDRKFLSQHADLWGGITIGLLVVAGWLVTGWLGFDEFEPTQLASLTFVAPVGSAIQYSMIATGTTVNFGIMVVIGVLAGSFLSANLRGQFRVVGFDDTYRMPRYLAGGVCMGVGGALAMGCSVGQGLTGFSTLSYVSMIAFASILLGARLALSGSNFPATKPV